MEKIDVGKPGRPGRPLKFQNVEELQQKIDDYFNHCSLTEDIPTIADMAIFLDTNRQTLLNYENYSDSFFDTIKKAKDRVLAIQEKAALRNKLNPAVWIFSAKNNFGYTDKQEIIQTGGNQTLNQLNINILGKSDLKGLEQLLARAIPAQIEDSE